jgi:hypothetical protein
MLAMLGNVLAADSFLGDISGLSRRGDAGFAPGGGIGEPCCLFSVSCIKKLIHISAKLSPYKDITGKFTDMPKSLA